MTEDHRSTLSPQEMEGRFDLLASESKEYAVFLVEPGGKLLCWNPGAERIFGYRADEIVGQHFSRFFSPEDIRKASPSTNSRRRRLWAGPTAFAGRCAKTAHSSGAGRLSPLFLTRTNSCGPSRG